MFLPISSALRRCFPFESHLLYPIHLQYGLGGLRFASVTIHIGMTQTLQGIL
jgi:hypothetical protein